MTDKRGGCQVRVIDRGGVNDKGVNDKGGRYLKAIQVEIRRGVLAFWPKIGKLVAGHPSIPP